MTFWFDMDGVMAVYNREDYRDANPQYLKEGYYKGLQPDKYIKRLIEYLNRRADCDVYILTKVSPMSDVRWYQVSDKLDWLHKHFPFLDDTQFFYTIGDKDVLARAVLRRNLNSGDVLMDDYNPNLIGWENSGGSSIKYLNGLNNPESFDGKMISFSMELGEALRIILGKNVPI